MLIQNKSFIDDDIPLRNFEFRKKNCSIVNKILFLPKFSVVSFFTKGWIVQKMEPKGNSIELRKFLKYGLTEVKKAPS